jgi:hypothetical protein
MTMPDQPPETTSDLEQEGIPDLEGEYPGETATGVSQEGVVVPGDRPLGAEEFGTTAVEGRQDEPFSVRAEREEPDLAAVEATGLGAGERMVEPPWGALDADEEGELIGNIAGDDTGALSSEEAAMHVTGEDGAPGVTWDESPDYVGDEAPGGGTGEAPPG